MKTLLTTLILLFSTSLYAANLPALKKLFTDNYDNFYRPGLCGKNVAQFVTEANKKGIDLSNSFVLKVEGAGFLETSGFYTRNNINERAMLGYFHMIFIADGYVFDFDLDEPLVLTMEDYVRLQFTPPYEPFNVFGIKYKGLEQLPHWTVTRFEWTDYIKNREVPTWKHGLGKVINLNNVMARKRFR